jgi:hypothetical protein
MKKETLEDLVNKMKVLDDKVDLFAYSLGCLVLTKKI